MAAPAISDLMTTQEAADYLRVSPVTISRWVKQGRLSAYRVGPRAVRFRRSDLEGLLAPANGIDDVVSDENDDGRKAIRPLTDEEVEQRLEALRGAQELREQILARRGGVPLSSSAEIIAEERRKRSEQLAGVKSMVRFTAVFEQADGWWIGYVEELPGANTQGRTLDETRENLREAVRLVIDANREIARQDAAGRDVIREELDLATE